MKNNSKNREEYKEGVSDTSWNNKGVQLFYRALRDVFIL